MGAFGLGYGLGKVIIGTVTGDSEMLVKGLKKTGINAVATVVDVCTGKFFENMGKDRDNDT